MSKSSAFSVVLREIRRHRGLSQEDLSGILELSVEAISKLERGVTKPRLETLERLSRTLKVPMPRLLGYLDGEHKERDLKRLKLETKLSELARKADLKTLQMLVRQFQAVINGD